MYTPFTATLQSRCFRKRSLIPLFHFTYQNLHSGHKDEVNQIRVNPSRTRLASCSDDGTVTIWKLDSLDSGDSIPGLASLDYVAIFKGHEHSINTVTWCPDQIPGAHEIVIT